MIVMIGCKYGLRLGVLSIFFLSLCSAVSTTEDTIQISIEPATIVSELEIDTVIDGTGRVIYGEFHRDKQDHPSVFKFKTSLTNEVANAWIRSEVIDSNKEEKPLSMKVNFLWLDGYELKDGSVIVLSMNVSFLRMNEDLGEFVELHQAAIFDTVSCSGSEQNGYSRAVTKGISEAISRFNHRRHLNKLYLKQVDLSKTGLDAVNKPDFESIDEGVYLSFEDFREGFALPYTSIDFIEKRGLNNGLRQIKLPVEETREMWGVYKEGQLFLNNGERKLLPVVLKEGQILIEEDAISPGEASLYAAFTIIGGGLLGAAVLLTDMALTSDQEIHSMILDYSSGRLLEHKDWDKRYGNVEVRFYADYFMKKKYKLNVVFDGDSCILSKNEVAIFTFPIDTEPHHFRVSLVDEDDSVRGVFSAYKSIEPIIQLQVDKKSDQIIQERLDGSKAETIADEIAMGRIDQKCKIDLSDN